MSRNALHYDKKVSNLIYWKEGETSIQNILKKKEKIDDMMAFLLKGKRNDMRIVIWCESTFIFKDYCIEFRYEMNHYFKKLTLMHFKYGSNMSGEGSNFFMCIFLFMTDRHPYASYSDVKWTSHIILGCRMRL